MENGIIFALITILTMLYSAWIVSGQRKTIDKLTDKLMAKDLTEYRRGTVEVHQETKQRKPISFYDDPSIELDEVN